MTKIVIMQTTGRSTHGKQFEKEKQQKKGDTEDGYRRVERSATPDAVKGIRMNTNTQKVTAQEQKRVRQGCKVMQNDTLEKEEATLIERQRRTDAAPGNSRSI